MDFLPEIPIKDVLQYLQSEMQEYLRQIFSNGDSEAIHKAQACFKHWQYFSDMGEKIADAVLYSEGDDIYPYKRGDDYLDLKKEIRQAEEYLSLKKQ